MTPLNAPTALAAVDDALDAGRVTAEQGEERELQELALALEADTPEPDPDFAAELEELVRDGFPKPRRWRPRVPSVIRRLPRPSGRVPLAAGVAASLLLATLIAVALSTDEGAREGRSEQAQTLPQELDSPAPGAAVESGDPMMRSTVPEPPGDDLAPGEDERRIERSATLTLAAPDDKLEEVADGITAIADRRRGFVLRSSVTSGDDGATGGSFELRVPASALQATLSDLAGLADVRSRSQSGDDITPAYVSTRDRLVAAQAERESLVRRLRRADNDNEADAIRDRLLGVSAEIRGLRSELRRLRERTNYAAVSVELEPKDEDTGSEDDGDSGIGGSTGDAFDDALGSLVGALNLALRVIGVLIPLALVAGLGWLVLVALRRRRREAALS